MGHLSSKPNTLREELLDAFSLEKEELENEFSNGNLEHPFFISSEYYLELKLKDIKQKLINGDNQKSCIKKDEQ